MKKSMLSFLALAITTSLSAGATAASLDVHGDIKVNGKTVIDSKGNLVQPAPEPHPNLIDMADYQPKGNAIITLQRTAWDGAIEKLVMVYENGEYVKEETTKEGRVTFSQTWSERTADSVLVSKTNEKCSENSRYDFSLTSGYSPIMLGESVSRIDMLTTTVLDTTCKDSMPGDKAEVNELYKITPYVKSDYNYGEGDTVKDCFVAQFEASWSPKDQLRTYCKGVGPVELGEVDNPYKLVSIE
ncbi:hypothetical protein [Photobacterium swingsii]|uniref:hypothetical protein n=1 Tax=Photobacterium swingsii TaxID=680026 RepID=UPI004068D3A4